MDEAAEVSRSVEVGVDPAANGTRVAVTVGGWERLTGGAEIARGSGDGAKEPLGWYAEAAASA
jgi:hypothetical protein